MYSVEEFDILKTKVLKYILYKKRTEQEIITKFADYKGEILDDVIDYLKDAGYINDKEYIRRAVNEYINLKNLSLKEISYKLYTKGLKRDIIDEYITQFKDELEEYEVNSAKNIINKKISTMNLEDIILLLKKKGYKGESIRDALEGMNINE